MRFSGLSPEPKMPSSGNKLKSQQGRKKCNRAENVGKRMGAGNRGQGKPRRASEHHVTLQASKKQAKHAAGNSGDPRSNHTGGTKIKSVSLFLLCFGQTGTVITHLRTYASGRCRDGEESPKIEV